MPFRTTRSEKSSPGQRPRSTIAVNRCIDSAISGGANWFSDRHAPVGGLEQTAVTQADPRRDVPGRRDRFDRLGGGGGRRVVEQRAKREHDSRPQRVGHAVQVADLEPAPGPHRRKQRGQVVVQVGRGGAAAGRAATRPSAQSANGTQSSTGCGSGSCARASRVPSARSAPSRWPDRRRWRPGSGRSARNPDGPTPAAGSTASR